MFTALKKKKKQAFSSICLEIQLSQHSSLSPKSNPPISFLGIHTELKPKPIGFVARLDLR